MAAGNVHERKPQERVDAARRNVMLRRAFLPLTLAAVQAASGSVLDDAKVWWRFDRGGADGAVVQAAEIHDVRDASRGVPTQLCGPSGGPLWTNTTVRLPYRRAEAQGSALYVDVKTNANGQTCAAKVACGDGYVHSDSVTFFARVNIGEWMMPMPTDAFIYNNCFVWGATKEESYGQLFGVRLHDGRFVPRFIIGQEGLIMDRLTMEAGHWYELAFSVTHTGEVQRVLCVLAGENGLSYQTIEKPFRRAVDFADTTGMIGGETYNAGWIDIVNNHTCRNFHGLVHELALWDRGLTLGEILDVFGRPAAPFDGDVYVDAFRWWKFSRDLDGDGKVSSSEVREVRKWGTAAAPATGGPVPGFVTDGGPLAWRNMSVSLPARGETAVADCLVMEPEYRTLGSGVRQVRPARILFPETAVAGDITLVARICLTKALDPLEGDREMYLYNNGFHYGDSLVASGGHLFGLISAPGGDPSTDFVPRFFAGQQHVSVNGLVLTTNVWYDIAYAFSTGSDGRNQLTVALADDQHGIRTWSGVLKESQYVLPGGTVVIGGQSDEVGWQDCVDANGNLLSAGVPFKNFTGAIHQLAVWNRGLTKDEIAAAFGHPHAVFGVGTADGTSGEFAAADEGTYDYTVSDTWHDMAGTLDAAHPTLTLRFTPPPSWDGMDQGFHLAAGNVAGTNVNVSLTVNGTAFGAQAIGSGGDAWWSVTGACVQAGANVATLTLSGGPEAAVAIDKIEMLGSWALVSGVGGTFSREGDGQGPDYYVGDRNLAHVTRAVTARYPDNRLHFWLPGHLALNFPFDFTFRTSQYADGNAAFAIGVNGENVFVAPRGLVNAERTIRFAPGTLRAGWNAIEMRFLEGGGGWVLFPRYSLRLQGTAEVSPFQSPALVLGAATSMEKVRPRDGFAVRPIPAEGLGVRLARNEYESLQVLVAPRGRALRNVRVGVGDLTGPLGVVFAATNIACDVTGYVEIRRQAPYKVGCSAAMDDAPGYWRMTAFPTLGWWPDPILNFMDGVDIAGTDVQSFWVRVHCPEHQPAGTYCGALTVSADGVAPVQVPFAVRVNGFTLGRVSPLPLAITFAPEPTTQLEDEAGLAAAAARWADPLSPVNLWAHRELEWGDFLADYYITMDSLYHTGQIHLDVLERLKSQGRLGLFNLGYWSYPASTNAADVTAWRNSTLRRLRLAYSVASWRGLLDHAYVYGCDEVKTNFFPEIRLAVQELKAALPGVPVSTTAVDDELGVGTSLDVMDWFTPLTMTFDVEKAAASRAAGHQVWWYICCSPTAPFANMFIECPAIEGRLLMGAQAVRMRPDGFLYYEISIWNSKRCITSGPFTDWDPRSWTTYHGDGSWTCVGPDGRPLPTIRLENFRDGLEDYAYAKLLEERLAARGGRDDAWSRKARELLAVPREVMDTMRNYTGDPAAVYRWRDAMADLIESARTGLMVIAR